MMLRTNEYPGIGHFNTQRVTLTKVVLHPDEPPIEPDEHGKPYFLRYQPLYLVVKIDTDEDDKKATVGGQEAVKPPTLVLSKRVPQLTG